MQSVISNKIIIFNPTNEVKAWVEENLVIVNPLWEQMKRLGKEDMITRKKIPYEMKLYSKNGEGYILPFGTLYALWSYIKSYPYALKLNKNEKVIDQKWKISTPLFEYQEEAVQQMLAAKGGVLVAPCSAGKTNMMVEIIKRIGERFLFIVHTGDLLRQFYDRAKSLYPELDIGKITEGEFKVGKHGAVATIQTLDKVDPDLYRELFNVVVVDECVHVSGSPTLSKMFSRVLGTIPARYKFGCTATPSRSDTLIKTMYTILGLNKEGEFAPVYQISRGNTNSLTAKHIRVDTGTPFDYNILDVDGTFNYKNLIDYLSFDKMRNKLIIEKTKELLEDNRKVLLLCARVDQCDILNELLQEEHIASVSLTGSVSAKKRDEVIKEKVAWDVICSTLALFKEGIDIKNLDAEILCTPVNDKGMVIQCVGRVERYKEGKRTPLVLDMVDEKIPYCVNRYKKRERYLKSRY